MSAWRPEEWLNPCVSLVSMSSDNPEGRAFEAGADAMLEAVCAEIEKGLLTDEEIGKAGDWRYEEGELYADCVDCGLDEERLREVVKAQLQKILALLK